MDFRAYDPTTDSKAAHRIWRETGWVDDDDTEKAMDIFLAGSDVLVAQINGEAECLVASMPGHLRYLEQDLPLAIVAAVTTSRIARKQGLASRLTARLLAKQAGQGAVVSALGMFEQGYYNQLGFGTGPYVLRTRFDPASLTVPAATRPPRRITADDYAQVHAALLDRHRSHGGVNITPPEFTHAELKWDAKSFVLGYYDGEDGELTHFVWCSAKGEYGPYRVTFLAYQTSAQFLELMGLIKNLGDQVRTVAVADPAHIQLQDLIIQPFRRETVSEKTKHETGTTAAAYWQMRLLDVRAALAQTSLQCEDLRFNLTLTDPVTQFVDEDSAWQGVGGDYVVTLGNASSAVAGIDKSLPTLSASVGAFTRLWLGVRPATGLAITDDLDGSDDLLRALDRALLLPTPLTDWDF